MGFQWLAESAGKDLFVWWNFPLQLFLLTYLLYIRVHRVSNLKS